MNDLIGVLPKARTLVHYDQEIGGLVRTKTGIRAGWVGWSGYRFLRIGRSYTFAEHRLIWALHTGECPVQIDHINGNRLDNRIENLRSVDMRENQKNKRIPANNTSGHIGVVMEKEYGMWKAYIKVAQKRIHLGSFRSKAEAINARKLAEQKYGFHENHGRLPTSSGE